MSVESMSANGVATQIQQPNSQQVASQPQEITSVAAAAPEKEHTQEAAQQVEEVQAAVDKLNDLMGSERNLNFSIDKETENLVVKVMDTQTQEIIRQFPSEESLKLAKHIEGMMGLIFNDHA